jgi:hypothetical protein
MGLSVGLSIGMDVGAMVSIADGCSDEEVGGGVREDVTP